MFNQPKNDDLNDPEHRAKAKASTAARKDKRTQEIANAVAVKRAQFVEQHRDAIKWLHAKADAGSNFATSLLGGLDRFGSLTPGQLDAIERFKVQDIERAATAVLRNTCRSSSRLSVR